MFYYNVCFARTAEVSEFVCMKLLALVHKYTVFADIVIAKCVSLNGY